MSEILTDKQPSGHQWNSEDTYYDHGDHDYSDFADFLLPDSDEAIPVSEHIDDKREQAHQFSDEMKKLGFSTKVLEGEHNPLPDMLHSLTLVDHSQLPDGPTVRLYRGIRPIHGREMAHQVGYILKKPIPHEEFRHIERVDLENEETFRAVENFADNPSYRALMEAVEASSMSKDDREHVDGRIGRIRRALIKYPHEEFIDNLIHHHISSPWGPVSQDISPFVATSNTPDYAASGGGKMLMILDVPLSAIAGIGGGTSKGDEVLVIGSVQPEWITAVADVKYDEHMSVGAYAPLVEAIGGQEATPLDALMETEFRQKSRLNHEADLREINQDLIGELLSTPGLDATVLREIYDSRNIETYQDALWAAADYYFKQVRSLDVQLPDRREAHDIHEVYQYDDVTHTEHVNRLALMAARAEDDDIFSEDSRDPDPKELNINEVKHLATICSNVIKYRTRQQAIKNK